MHKKKKEWNTLPNFKLLSQYSRHWITMTIDPHEPLLVVRRTLLRQYLENSSNPFESSGLWLCIHLQVWSDNAYLDQLPVYPARFLAPLWLVQPSHILASLLPLMEKSNCHLAIPWKAKSSNNRTKVRSSKRKMGFGSSLNMQVLTKPWLRLLQIGRWYNVWDSPNMHVSIKLDAPRATENSSTDSLDSPV